MRSAQPFRFMTQLRCGKAKSGNVLVLSAAAMIMTFAFVTFTVDLGFITVTKTQLQGAVDGGALAAGLELEDGLGDAPLVPAVQMVPASSAVAADVVSRHRAGDHDSTYIDQSRDVRFGQYQLDPVTGNWQQTWGAAPYNMVEVAAHRDQRYMESGGSYFHYDFSNSQWVYDGNGEEAQPNEGDSELPLFFGPVIGHKGARVSADAVAALLPGVGFRVQPGESNADVLPIALDEETWNDLMNGVGTDDYSYDPNTEQVAAGADGVLEVNLYPNGSSALPPGNRGTVDFGNSNNSTADLSRQILDGLNADDLSYFGGEVRTDLGPLSINGDTGLSAGIKDELDAIKGKARAISLFTEVSGPGNNAMYTIVKFVGVRVMYVKLTGGNKRVIVQPAVVVDRNVIPGPGTVSTTSIYTTPRLIE